MLHLKKFLHFYLLIFLNIIFVLLRLPDFYRPLWNDELITLRTVLVNPLENPLYNGVSTNLPLFYYLVKLFSFIFEGDNLRIISLICSILILNIFIFRYLKEKDLTLDFPIIVNKQMEIIDGQHTFEACKFNGLPIYYMFTVLANIDDISNINSVKKKWTMEDFLHQYVEKGNIN